MLASIIPTDGDYPLSPAPSWAYPALTVLCILSILLPAGVVRLSFGAALSCGVFYLVVWTSAPNLDGYTVGVSASGLLLRWIDLVAIHTPEKDFWRVNEEKNGDRKTTGHVPNDKWGKLKWFCGLFLSQRGLGWNIEPANFPSLPKDYPRGLFLKQTSVRTIKLYVIIDVLQNLITRTYHGHGEHFFEFPYHMQLFLSWAVLLVSYNGIEFFYSIGALISVSTRICVPSDWPSITGSFSSNFWSIRKLWGTSWHQMMRRQGGEAGRLVKKLCGFKDGTFMSRYSQLWMAFIVSAAVHHAGAMTGGYTDGGLTQAICFLIQPLGIMLEDGIIALGKRLGLRDGVWTKRIGYLWVFIWFSFCMPYMIAGYPRSRSQELIIPSFIKYLAMLITKY